MMDANLKEIVKRNDVVLERQKTVETIAAELKDAKKELDVAVLDLTAAIQDAKMGQGKLEFPDAGKKGDGGGKAA